MERLLTIIGAACLLTACNNPAPSADAAEPAAEAAPQSSSDPVPVCGVGDDRTMVPVWRPSVDEDGNLSSDPPQEDGMIVYIRLHQDAAKTACDDQELNSFSRPADPGDIMGGGLAVNILGNTQFANGTCHFSGYYMNEEVMGMHQGWIETFYGAVEKREVVMSGRYCLAESID